MKDLDFRRMSVNERLQMMESIWSSLCQESEAIESPDWHTEILKERKAKLESGEAKFISLETLKGYNIAKN
ncbi:addiction module protein [Marinicella gelatinilytica]|uniref:addiction module protein n=1 Tax=Marinicella gelatinilytica TaxID=2996017 RepID=UPI002260B303|nr:addiction module protein [Marinicella gelatinilytica]MCX7546305.1 addiction module protein [Marinicella gelatinilytica]